MIKEAIIKLVDGRSLSEEEASEVMEEIMQGQATPAQFGAFATALRIKGETVAEITGLAKVMRGKVVPVKTSGPVVDTCGTGGDGAGTFNISTAAAFVAAAGGLRVAKHGNRAMSSCCGSADVLEALGVKIDMNAECAARCLEEVGICFMFAPLYHPAMKHAALPRREIGIRTIFNILGPLTNPANACAQVMGVTSEPLAEKIILVIKELGCRHALIVTGEDGLDEITVTGHSKIFEIKDANIRSYYVNPEDFGLPLANIKRLAGGTAEENAAMIRGVLYGADNGAKRNAVLLNAAAAFVAGDAVEGIADGIKMAADIIDNGSAMSKMEDFIQFSQSIRQEV